jgi:hypothetical protein
MKKVLVLALILSSIALMAWAAEEDVKIPESPQPANLEALKQAEAGYFEPAQPQEAMEPEQPQWQPEFGAKGELLNQERAVTPFGAPVPDDQPNDPPRIQTVVLNESFNNWGPYGDVPPAGWAINDLGAASWDNNDWHKYYNSGWTDTVARVYYSPIENQDDWLITPAANFVGAVACSMSCYLYYFDEDATETDSLLIIGSANGVNWTDTIAIYTVVSQGNGTNKAASRIVYNITSFAQGDAAYKVAFVYRGNNGWYVYLDDLMLWSDANLRVTQNFSGWGIYGNNPPAGWTILALTPYAPAWDNNDWHKYYYSTWLDTVARVYYAPAEQQNEWLITPALNLAPALDQVILTFKQFYDDGSVTNDTARVLGSTDGGATWPYTVATYQGADQGSGAAPSRPVLDVTSWANGRTNVKFAFRYVGSNSIGSWYVDSVKVETIDLVSNDVTTQAVNTPNMVVSGYNWPINIQVRNAGDNTVTFRDSTFIYQSTRIPAMYEDFNDPVGWTGANPPTGWTVIDSGGNPGVWDNTDWHQYYNSASGDTVARVYYVLSTANNAWLVSPVVDASALSNVHLTFRTYYNWEGTTDTAYILGTTDNWSSTVQIDKWYTDHGTSSALARYDYDISSWASGEANLQIAFKYIGLYDLYWYVDDAEIYTPAPPTVFYQGGQAVTSLVSLESRAVPYSATWNDPNPGEYSLQTFTKLAADINRHNDTLTIGFNGYEHFESGGPDAGNYVWATDKDGGTGSPYAWRDITGIGTPVTWNLGSNHDRYTSSVPMGFNFLFYGNTYSRLFISENGFASFDSITATELLNYGIPSISGQDNLVALLWDDLSGVATGQAYFYTNNVDTFIVSYTNWDFNVDTNQRIDMQMIFCGSNASIKYQYQNVGPVIYTSHTIGIEDDPGSVGLQFEYNGAPMGNIAMPGLAVSFRFNPPAHDIMTDQFLAPLPSGIRNVPVIPQVSFANLGASAETNIPVRLLISPGGYNNAQTIPSIPFGGTGSASFASFTPTTSGVYTLTAIAQLGTDVVPTNDTLQMTFTVFDNLIDFEANNGGFDVTRDWQWGAPTSGPMAAYSGANCWGTNIAGNYTAGISEMTFHLQIGTTAPSFSFAHWYDTEVRYDGGHFAVSTDDGASWNVISPLYGYDDTCFTPPIEGDSVFTGHIHSFWDIATFPLTDYAGQTVLAKLAFNADGSVFYSGWYVDDMGFIDCQVFRPTNDMRALQVLSPPSLVVVGNSTPVKTLVQNRGSATQINVPVRFIINDSTGAQVYTANTTIPSIAPLAIDSATFTAFTPAFVGTFSTISYTTLPGESLPYDDTVRSTFIADMHYGQGGPDAYNYRWKDNTVGGGPVYNWVDITGDGTLITTWNGSVDEGRTGLIAMGLPSGFWYYGTTYTDIEIGTNGWASLLDQTGNFLSNYQPPHASAPAAGMMVNWDDLDGGTVGSVYYKHDAANNRFIVSWINWPYYPDPINPCDFQLILNGNDSSVVMQYGIADSGRYQYDITAGVQNETKTIGLSYYYGNSTTIPGTPRLNLPYDGLAIKFKYSPLAHDIRTEAFVAPDMSGMVGELITPQVTFRNFGSSTETSVPVRLTINPGGYNNLLNIPTLTPGQSTTITFPNFTPGSANIYTLTAISTLAADGDRTNDTLRMSYVVYNTLFDFESGPGSFNAIGDWQWGTPTNVEAPPAAYSGANCWGTGLAGDYTPGLHTLDFNLNIGTSTPALSIASWYYTEVRYDGCNFGISTDAGASWIVISPTRGYDDTSRTVNPLYPDSILTGGTHRFWEVLTFPLNDYAGASVMARFAFGADPSVQYSGWFIDDLGLIDCQVVTPNMVYNPTSVSGTAPVGGNDIEPITINNTGQAILRINADAIQSPAGVRMSSLPRVTEPSPNMEMAAVIDEATKGIDDPPMTLDLTCPTGSLYGQDPSLPTESWTFGTSDAEPNYVRYEYLSGINADVTQIHFWGMNAYYDVAWSVCNEETSAVQIVFYQDDFGVPGSPYATYNLNIVGEPTGQTFGSYVQKDFVVNFAPAVPLYGGWISIQGVSPNGCWFLWQNSFFGDGQSLVFDGTTMALDDFDLSLCVTGTDRSWLSVNPSYLEVAPGGNGTINAIMNATAVGGGTYHGAVRLWTNAPQGNVAVPATFVVTGGGGCNYVPGDINGNGSANGIDVTFGVAFFKGGSVPPVDCNPPCTGVGDPFYAAGDVNGNCAFNGIDITFYVAYLKGLQPALRNCETCPPGGLVAPAIELPGLKSGNVEGGSR